jgi:hypothetical protein
MPAKFIFFLVLATLTANVQAQECLSQLKNKTEFDNLAGLPLSGKYGQVSAVKVVYDLHSGKLYFVNNTFYKYHVEFCRSQSEDTHLCL